MQTDVCLDACIEAGDLVGACGISAEVTNVGWRGCKPGALRQNWTLTAEPVIGEAQV